MRRRGLPLVAALSMVTSLMGGCDTIGQDLNDWASGLFPPTPTEAAIMALDQNDPDRRREGILWLSNSSFGGAAAYMSMYRDYVRQERDPLVRAVAIRSLARWGDTDDALLIAPHLRDENAQVRWEAAKGLQRIHQPAVVSDLTTVLGNQEERTDVRVASAIALGQYPEDRVVQALISALDQRSLVVNAAAAESLRTLTGEDLGLDARAWLRWYDPAASDPFDTGSEFMYPTYHRKDTFFERLVFWSKRFEEQPGIPAGLTPRNERRTSDFAGDPVSDPATDPSAEPDGPGRDG